MKQKILVLVAAVLGVLVLNIFIPPLSLKEGDIVFQISESSQSPFIVAATKSPWSHCGVIIEKEDGLYVLEASNKVKLTPYKEWRDRGFMKIVSKRRVTDEPIKIKYSKYLNTPYDLEFKFNNGKYYCSELVWDIYEKQFGISIGTPHNISDYNITNDKIKKLMKKRNISNDQLIISPADIK